VKFFSEILFFSQTLGVARLFKIGVGVVLGREEAKIETRIAVSMGFQS